MPILLLLIFTHVIMSLMQSMLVMFSGLVNWFYKNKALVPIIKAVLIDFTS